MAFSSLCRQDASKMPPRSLQDASKTLPRRLQDVQDASKTPPRRPQDAPRRSQDDPKTPQGAPKTPQDDSKTPPRGPRCLQDAISHARWPKIVPRWPQVGDVSRNDDHEFQRYCQQCSHMRRYIATKLRIGGESTMQGRGGDKSTPLVQGKVRFQINH